MADKKPLDEYPNFKGVRFGVGDLHTRRGRGLIDDDLTPRMSANRKPFETMHQRDEPEPTNEYARGGKVLNKKWWGKK
jgi:hypothetical protein